MSHHQPYHHKPTVRLRLRLPPPRPLRSFPVPHALALFSHAQAPPISPLTHTLPLSPLLRIRAHTLFSNPLPPCTLSPLAPPRNTQQIAACQSNTITAYAWHPKDVNLLAVATNDENIHLYDITADKELKCIKCPKMQVTAMEWYGLADIARCEI